MPKWKEPKPLKSNPKKAQEWQQRSQQAAIARLRERGAKLAPREAGAGAIARSGGFTSRSAPSGTGQPSRTGAAPRRKPPKHNDSGWRAECIAARGEYCRCCGKTQVQMDHIKPKGQGGKNDVENGLPLCEEHHRMKTDSEILIEWAWLDPDQRQYLATIGWVDWDEEGQPFGRGFKHFGTRPARPGL